MTKQSRTIQMPGAAAPEVTHPALAAGDGAAQDDLAAFDEDDLPQGPVPATAQMTPELSALVQRMIAEGVAAELAAAKHDAAQPKAPAERLPTWQEAAAAAERSVRDGVRPRSVLTSDGWYVHPELARVKDSGVARLMVEA
jgi:hypothetical protein